MSVGHFLHVEGEPGAWRVFEDGEAVSGVYAYKNDAIEAMNLGIYSMHEGVKS